MDAEEAKSVGFINQVYENREVMLREVTALARTIAAKSPLVVRGTKEMLLYSRDHSVAEGLNYIATWNAGMMSLRDLEEGITAQAEKRPASYED
jgi:enoyl-CoA hydratase